MLALRFGSYSMDSTLAGTPALSRRKSILRYCFLWPPPRCQIEISPWLLRPPERFFGSRRPFSGVSLVISLLSRTVMNRLDAVYGLKLFSPIAASYLLKLFLYRFAFSLIPELQVVRVLDHFFAFGQLDVRFLPIAPVTFVLATAAHLAGEIRGANTRDFHLENLLHGFLDLRFRGLGGNLKDDRRVQLLHAQTFFRDDRAANNLIV